MMRLGDLLAGVESASVAGDPDVAIAEARDDSRLVGPADLFVAVRGQTVDGHDFAADAAARGAAAIVVERDVAFPRTVVRVPKAAVALGAIAANRFGRPANGLILVGVTGTNGKTTTAHLCESILAAAGARPGLIGTVGYRAGGATRPAPMTTPTALGLHALFAEMRRGGCGHAVMEVSSHALALDRVAGLRFRVAAFTNLTRDHLDFHGTMDAYFDAKARLFSDHLAGDAVVQIDSPEGWRMAELARGRVLRVSLRGAADVRARAFRSTLDGVEVDAETPNGALSLRSRLCGEYNVANLLCAVGVGATLGLSGAAIERGVAALRGVPGRLEPVETGRGFHLFVDYAHTPDALVRVLATLRPLTPGRLVVVFGCGGDRDRTKRPLMGEAVATAADVAVVTSDNPRSEDPLAIIDEILAGARRAAPRDLVVEPDRRAAIRTALGKARPGDSVLIAGKGHEDYQILGPTRVRFDDREEARRALEEMP